MTEVLQTDTGYGDRLLNVSAPAGKLGVILVDSHSGGVIVSMVNNNSPLAGSLEEGDHIMSINGVNVSRKSVTGMYNFSTGESFSCTLDKYVNKILPTIPYR